MQRPSLSLPVLALALLACQPATPQRTLAASLATPVTLAMGQRATFEGTGLEVQFVSVVEDSRCPRDTTCVWAGEVRVQLEIRSKSAGSASHELLPTESVGVEGYRVTLLGVQPEPSADRKIAPAEYRATLSVERG